MKNREILNRLMGMRPDIPEQDFINEIYRMSTSRFNPPSHAANECLRLAERREKLPWEKQFFCDNPECEHHLGLTDVMRSDQMTLRFEVDVDVWDTAGSEALLNDKYAEQEVPPPVTVYSHKYVCKGGLVRRYCDDCKKLIDEVIK